MNKPPAKNFVSASFSFGGSKIPTRYNVRGEGGVNIVSSIPMGRRREGRSLTMFLFLFTGADNSA
jgi:hypothetical protein